MSTTSDDILRKMDLLDKLQTDLSVVVDTVKTHVVGILDEYYGVKQDANINTSAGESDGPETPSNSESFKDSSTTT